jgi:DNA ligase-1
MLAQPFDENRIQRWPVIVEPKLDGVRVIADIEIPTDTVKFSSRSGKPFTSFNHLKDPLLNMVSIQSAPNFVFDGEVVSGSFNNTVSEVRKKYEQAPDAVFYVFDVAGQLASLPYRDRRKIIEQWVPGALSMHVQVLPTYEAHSVQEIYDLYQRLRDKGFEGVIVKDSDSIYEMKRSYAWMKIKGYSSEDIYIVDAIEGTGKYVGMLGAIVAEYNGKKVKVGTGLTDDQRTSFWHEYTNGRLVGRLIEVGYHELTPAGSLRHPRFVRFRDTLEKGVKE